MLPYDYENLYFEMMDTPLVYDYDENLYEKGMRGEGAIPFLIQLFKLSLNK